MHSITSAGYFDPTLLSIIEDLQNFASMLDMRATNIIVIDNIEIEQIVAALRYRLLSCPSARITNTFTDLIHESIRLSSLLHLKIIFTDYPSRAHLYRLHVEKLRNVLAQMSIQSSTSEEILETTELVFWMCFMGGVLCAAHPSRDWFISRLADLTRSMGIDRWIMAKSILQKFLWVENAHDDKCRLLWDEVLERPNNRLDPTLL